MTLAIACEDDHSAIVSTLLKAGANPNVSNVVCQKLLNILFRTFFKHFPQRGQTPLLMATRKKKTDMVKELIEAKVDLNHMEEVSVTF